MASINARCRLVLGTLRGAVGEAIAHKCTRLVVAGDLLDYSRPEAPVLNEVQQTFRKAHRAGIEVVLMVGNHEQISTAQGDHALGVLSTYAIVVEKPARLGDLLCVPFRPGPAKDWLEDAVRVMLNAEGGAGPAPPPGPGPRTLAIHLGIRDDRTPIWLRNAPDSIHIDELFAICEEHAVTRVVAGNWHNHQTWRKGKIKVMQLGALCPTGWDNPGLDGYGTVAFLDGEALTKIEVPGPRFVATKSYKEATALVDKAQRAGCRPFLSLTVAPEDMLEMSAWVEASVTKGKLAGGEVLPDQEMAKHEAENASAAARGASNIDEALVDFVAHKPMPDTVDRRAVLSRCQEYMKP